jgi:hypothetical protein
MGFSNPIAAGDGGSLIRDSIKSGNFNDGTNGDPVAGWKIAKDGSATFTGLTVGGDNASVDSDGNATFATLSVTADDITVGGHLLLGETISDLPLGIVAYGSSTITTTCVAAGTELGMFEVQFEADVTRQYRLNFQLWYSSTVSLDNINFRVRDGGASVPTIASSPVIYQLAQAAVGATRVQNMTGVVVLPFTAGVHRLLLTIRRDAGTGTVSSQPGAPDRPNQFIIEDVGPIVSNIANPNAGGGGVTPVQNFVTNYTAVTEGWYNSAGVFQGSGRASQGDYANPGFNGNTKGAILFDYAQIQSDLAGATITKCQLYLYYTHWFFNAGGIAVIGYHNMTGASLPGSFGSITGVVSNGLQSANWPNPGGRWVNLGVPFGNRFFSGGTARGIIIGPAPSSSQAYYGYTSGIPQIRFWYTK